MVRLISRFARWLESRFPEKLVVSREDYTHLRASVNVVEAEVVMLKDEIAALTARLGAVETAAVHKGAVQDVIRVVEAVKTDIVALKANLGWSKPIVEGTEKAQELAAMLNGELING